MRAPGRFGLFIWGGAREREREKKRESPVMFVCVCVFARARVLVCGCECVCARVWVHASVCCVFFCVFLNVLVCLWCVQMCVCVFVLTNHV